MDKIKVLFLDIDGVLNHFNQGDFTPAIHFEDEEGKPMMTQVDPEKVFMLNKIVDRTDCELVLSSSWRHDPRWRDVMKRSGVVKDFLDRTDVKTKIHGGHNGGKKSEGRYKRCRGAVIQAWLDEHPEVEKYAIIDDEYDMLIEQGDNFFKTDVRSGLLPGIAYAIEQHLL